MACPSPFRIQTRTESEAAIQARGVSLKKLHFLPFLLLRLSNDTICTKFLCIMSEYILHVEINHSLCQNSKLPNFTVILFSFSAVRWQSTNQWATWIPTSFSIELCSRVNHTHPFEIATRQLPSPLLGHNCPKLVP